MARQRCALKWEYASLDVTIKNLNCRNFAPRIDQQVSDLPNDGLVGRQGLDAGCKK